MTPHRSALAAIAALLIAATPMAGAPVCKPQLTVKDIMFSQIHHVQRTWGARIVVDASRCAADHGLFAIAFVRLKETAPDAKFTDQFTGTPGVIEIAIEFWADEAVGDYTIIAPACRCVDRSCRVSASSPKTIRTSLRGELEHPQAVSGGDILLHLRSPTSVIVYASAARKETPAIGKSLAASTFSGTEQIDPDADHCGVAQHEGEPQYAEREPPVA